MTERRQSVATLVYLSLVAAVLYVLVNKCESYACEKRADKMGMDHDFAPIQGCMVRTVKGWRPIESLRQED